METEKILLTLSIALFAGLMLSRLAKLVKLPAVTAYLVAGILVGPFCLGAFNVSGLGFQHTNIDFYSIISDVALGFIAFTIGNEFRLSQLKAIGKQATVIGIVQAVVTTLVVDVALITLHFIMPDKLSLSSAIVLGAVASATAPAATLMVVRQYKAKGPLTDTLLPVVALDDAVGLVLFAISFGIGKAFLPGGEISFISIIVEPVIEVVLSVGLGALMGYVFTFFERFFHSRSKRLAMSVAFVFLTVGISLLNFEVCGIHIAFSSLLSCMMLGTIFCNICDFSAELMDRLDRWTAPIFILFFVISGAEFDLTVLTDLLIVLVGIVYILFRCLGKYLGAYSSAKMVNSPATVRKYLGITLFPQAGVALGMAIKATDPIRGLGAEGEIIKNIILFSVLIYELVGPFLTKISLIKAGEVNPEERLSARDKHLEELKKAQAE
jgi:Kef-type K+ transport system membrane component KefB